MGCSGVKTLQIKKFINIKKSKKMTKEDLIKGGMTEQQANDFLLKQQPTTNNQELLNKAFIDKLYVPAYKPTVYSSKIKENFTVHVSSYVFEAVDNNKAIDNITRVKGSRPNMPTNEELQKDGLISRNIVLSGTISTESKPDHAQVDRFVLNMNNLKCLGGFDTIENCFNANSGLYEIKSITVDNRLKRVKFSNVEM